MEMAWKKFDEEALKKLYKSDSREGKPLIKVKTKYGEEHIVFIEIESVKYRLKCNINPENDPVYVSKDDIEEYAIIGEEVGRSKL